MGFCASRKRNSALLTREDWVRATELDRNSEHEVVRDQEAAILQLDRHRFVVLRLRHSPLPAEAQLDTTSRDVGERRVAHDDVLRATVRAEGVHRAKVAEVAAQERDVARPSDVDVDGGFAASIRVVVAAVQELEW